MKLELARLPYLANRARTKLSDHFRAMNAVHVQHKHVLLQLAEAARLRLGRSKVSMSEYISQGLYSNQLYPDKELSRFGGWWLKEKIHAQLNDIRWEGMVTDKLILYGLLDKFGLPYPKIHAIAWKNTRSYGEVPVFRSPEPLADFIRDSPDIFPLFCKPVKGSYGYGAARVESFDAQSDTLVFSDGGKSELLPFLRNLKDGDGWGFLFQEAAETHEDMRPICGNAVSGCRVLMLLDDNGAYPYKIVWKIPARNNYIDNFHAGAFGNMAAAVDVNDGRVIRVVSGTGAEMKLNQPHPDTGFQLLGTRIPCWDEMMKVLKTAAESFPGFRWQHWDVGITAKGPMLYELNSAGHIDIIQMSYGEGIHEDDLQAFLDKCAKQPPPDGNVFSNRDA